MFVVLVGVFGIQWLSSTDGQSSITYENACCGTSIMEASAGLVVIETERVLATGSYTALKAKFCSPNAVWIQLWRRVASPNGADTKMMLRWQIRYNPGEAGISSSAVQVVTFGTDSAQLAIEDTDRLGLLVVGPVNRGSRYPVPYNTDASFTLYFSLDIVDVSSDLDLGHQVTMDDLRWPRSFRNYLVFCTTSTNCPSFGSGEGGGSMTTSTPTPAPPTCCSDCATREQVDQLTWIINNQSTLIQVLQTTVNTLISLINNLPLSGGNASNYTCPPGFTGGSPGVSNCYLVVRQPVQMAVAVLRCTDEHQAALLSIRSQAEQNFLKSLISGYVNTSAVAASGPDEYWTTGMYNFDTRTWVWYDESLRTKTSFAYRSWYGNEEPAPSDINDVCMTLDIDPKVDQAYWIKKYCFSLAYFICQVPKTCY